MRRRRGPGRIGLDATVGDVRIRTGDIVVGDRDGVVVIAADSLDAVRAAGEARAAKETDYFDQLRAGHTTIDLLDLDTSSIIRNSSA